MKRWPQRTCRASPPPREYLGGDIPSSRPSLQKTHSGLGTSTQSLGQTYISTVTQRFVFYLFSRCFALLIRKSQPPTLQPPLKLLDLVQQVLIPLCRGTQGLLLKVHPGQSAVGESAQEKQGERGGEKYSRRGGSEKGEEARKVRGHRSVRRTFALGNSLFERQTLRRDILRLCLCETHCMLSLLLDRLYGRRLNHQFFHLCRLQRVSLRARVWVMK